MTGRRTHPKQPTSVNWHIGQIPTFHESVISFHDSHLVSFDLGPRNEITLYVAFPVFPNQSTRESIALRFGAIENMEPVKLFFKSINSPPDRYIGEITNLEKTEKNAFFLEIEYIGSVTIRANKITAE